MAVTPSFIENVNSIAKNLIAIIYAGELFDDTSAALLEELAVLDITLLTEDLKKGNYLGNRKIDINLTLNNLSDTTHVSYSNALLVLNDGTQLDMPFVVINEDETTSILELTSHADIKNYIATHQLFIDNVVNTEITVEDEIGDSPQIIRIKDADGYASNIDRITLSTYSGQFEESSPSYFWAKTTSSLQTLANRAGDIIALGNDIDSIIALADKQVEIQYLYDVRTNLQSLYDNIALLLDVESSLASINAVNANEVNIIAVNENKPNIDIVASKNSEITVIALNINEILQSNDHAQVATEQAQIATDKANSILSLQGEGQTLAAGEPVDVSYNSITGILKISVPQGAKGDKGEAFNVDAQGTIALRSTFDNQPLDFSYFATDESKIYFKQSAATGDWNAGSPFGKGDTGNGIGSIAKTNTVGIVDTYTIVFTDSSVTNFQIVNGNGINNIAKTNTVGSVDTYTITFDNGDMYQYQVTNGSVTSVNGNTGNVTVQEVLESGTNLKTINSISLLGSEDITVQEVLESGTNLKTINSISLLGNGNIDVNPTIGELTKSFLNGEMASVMLSSSQSVASVSVQKEVFENGVTADKWNTATDGANYEQYNFALDTTITPSDTTGNIVVTLGSGTFSASNIGMKITGNGGEAILDAIDGSATVLVDFLDTSAIVAGSWNMSGIDFNNDGIIISSSLIPSDVKANPNMTAPSATVVATGTGTASGWKAFDGLSSTHWLSQSIGSKVVYDFGVITEITKYRFSVTLPSYRAKGWSFLGSNTGVFLGEETVLDTQSAYPTPVAPHEWYEKTLEAPASYRYYAIVVDEAAIATSIMFTIIEMFSTQPNYIANEHLTVITNEASQMDSNYWINLNSIIATETLNNQTINYAISPDNRTSWQIAKTTAGTREIARDNNGVWEFNSDSVYLNTTWTVSTVNNEFQALSEAMTVTVNQMSSTQALAVTNTEWMELGTKLNLTRILYTDDASVTPIAGDVSINYDANIKNEEAIKGVDYICDQPANDEIRIEALSALNLKIRVSK